MSGYKDRIGYFNSISIQRGPDAPEDEYNQCAIKFFDELMGLYDTLKNFQCNVTATATGDHVLLCTVELESIEEAISIEQYLAQHNIIEIYGKTFDVYCTRSADNNVVSIVMRTIGVQTYN